MQSLEIENWKGKNTRRQPVVHKTIKLAKNLYQKNNMVQKLTISFFFTKMIKAQNYQVCVIAKQVMVTFIKK